MPSKLLCLVLEEARGNSYFLHDVQLASFRITTQQFIQIFLAPFFYPCNSASVMQPQVFIPVATDPDEAAQEAQLLEAARRGDLLLRQRELERRLRARPVPMRRGK